MTIQQRIPPGGSAASAVRESPRWIVGRRAAAAACVAALVALGLLLSSPVVSIVSTWYGDVTFNHGFLIVPICLYLAWQERQVIAVTPVRPSLLGLFLVALGAGVWLLGSVAGALVVQELAIVAIAQAMICTIFGWRMVRVVRFPLLYLYFAVPFGIAMVPPLQQVTAFFSVALLHMTGIPIFVDGNFISVPNGNFEIAEACSGIRYLIASVALGVLLAGTMYRSWWRRIVFMLLSVAVPIVANGIRAFGIILIAYLTNNEYATGIDHIFYGWVFFTLVTFMLLALGWATSDGEVVPVTTPLAGPVYGSDRVAPLALVAAALSVALVFGATAYAGYVNRPIVTQVRSPAIPQAGLPFQAETGARDASPPKFVGAAAELHQSYVAGRDRVNLHIALYAQQRRNAEVLGAENVLISGVREVSGVVGETSASLAGTTLSVNFVRMVVGQRSRLVWYWYWVDGRFVANPYLAKLLQVKAKLLQGTPAAAMIVVTADYLESPAQAEQTLRAFLSHIDPLATVLEQASAQ
jgi:exosortase A